MNVWQFTPRLYIVGPNPPTVQMKGARPGDPTFDGEFAH